MGLSALKELLQGSKCLISIETAEYCNVIYIAAEVVIKAVEDRYL